MRVLQRTLIGKQLLLFLAQIFITQKSGSNNVKTVSYEMGQKTLSNVVLLIFFEKFQITVESGVGLIAEKVN